MSLIHFHRFLIGTGIVFCAGYAAWEFNAAATGGGAAAFALGAIFAVLAVGLIVYLRNLRRILGYERSFGPR